MPRSDWAREPQLLSLRVWSLCSATREATIVRGPRTAMKSGPRLPQLEKALTQKRRPNRAIKKQKKKNKKNTHSLKKKKKSWSKKSGQHTYSKSFYNVNDPDPTSLFCDSVLRKEPLSLLGWVVPFCSWRELSIMAFLYPMRWWIMTHTQPVMVTGQSKWTCDFHQDRDAL